MDQTKEPKVYPIVNFFILNLNNYKMQKAGYRITQKYLQNPQKYDIKKQTLEEVETTGNIPSVRNNHALHIWWKRI